MTSKIFSGLMYGLFFAGQVLADQPALPLR
jgi:hypothetical protein